MGDKKNINNVNYDDLKKIHGIDDSKANNILEYIEDHHPIMNMGELKNVNGVNNSIIDELKGHFSTANDETQT